ncbi:MULTISPECIES: prepilin peptidase [Thermomonosporaceae]|uniref:prepilin peptidase n=1 Tax=Thermomonosporaceae TaxID=2012 RepID=UPI00255AAF44|nr:MULTISPECIES: A24 family peptidase [Thermomonosporaceae]MDL4771045.1 A24 family peptidase [Actinomadura xylanilytica]
MEAPRAAPPITARPPRAEWIAALRRRPAVAALVCAAVLAALAWRIGARPELPAFLVLGAAGSALAIADLATRTLPDPLTLGSYATGAVLLGAAAPFTAGGGARYVHALIGMAALWLLFAVLWVIRPDALGRGDVKLAGALGLHLGWLGADAWLLGMYGTFVLGGVVSVVLLLLRRAGRKTMVPYGPYMLAAALAAVLVHAP